MTPLLGALLALGLALVHFGLLVYQRYLLRRLYAQQGWKWGGW